MSMRWCYLGDLGPGGELDWGQPGGGNIPTSGSLPDLEDLRLYIAIMLLATEGCYRGAIIDHDAYGLKVNGPDLRRIITECYKDTPAILREPVIAQYLEYADTLELNHFVALVAVAM